ncbi:PIN domain-containing protein [uncultured Cohaesibacter sp.]|uniref:PIN domain-containing protein n=1 Tax=uncultured Cohaesibacter sp. TaxID=1002546 RepID=UPI0029C8E176|nr:PIN domain-containing protein [uncultured Cohaesibacter sp.]
MLSKEHRVFLDANIYIQAGKHLEKPEFKLIKKLHESGVVKLITTDLTIDEVAKKHAKNEMALLKDVHKPAFRKAVKKRFNVEIPLIDPRQLQREIFIDFKKSLGLQLLVAGVEEVSVSMADPLKILDDYTHEKGIFSGEGKKDQFPDAFILETLCLQASEDDQLVIVSNDKDFEKVCAHHSELTYVDSIPQLFAKIGLEPSDHEVSEFLNQNNAPLVDMASFEISSIGFASRDEQDARLYPRGVRKLEINDATTYSVGEDRGSILVIGNMTCDVLFDLEYQDPHNPYEMIEETDSCEVDLNYALSILLSEDGEYEDIEALSLSGNRVNFIDLPLPPLLKLLR